MPEPEKPGSSAPDADAGPAERREDQLLAAVGALRELIGKSVVITAERLQETVDEAVRLGRMTRQDAEELVTNLVEIGRRQTQDTLERVRRAAGLG